MSGRRQGWAALAVVAVLAGVGGLATLASVAPLAGVVDPAVEFHTSGHEAGFGGIDRWAYRGMRAEAAITLLRQAGYQCGESSARRFGGGAFGKGVVTCVRHAQWPLPRTLTVRLDIDHDRHGRLVAARAGAVLADGPDGPLGTAVFLRRLGWIEAETLPVRGFELDSAQTLARQAVDALVTGGWRRVCEEATPYDCTMDARRRRTAGFPPLPPEPIRVGGAMALRAAMERIALWSPAERGADGKPEDSLPVRVEGDRLWADFVGGDLTGRQASVRIELDGEGGRPVRLVAHVGEESVSLALAGSPRQGNDGRIAFLVPEAGAAPYRIASWVYPPGQEASRESIAHFARDIAQADPAFAPRLVQGLLARLTAAARPDERLGLYPALSRIDRLADTLRETGVVHTLPRRPALADDPVARAAWALARCESDGRPPVIDTACWRTQVAEDADVLELLRQEVSRLDGDYAPLDVAHPIRRRLSRLREALAAGPSGS